MMVESDARDIATPGAQYWSSTEAGMDTCLPHNKGAAYSASREAYEKRLQYDCMNYSLERYQDVANVARTYSSWLQTNGVLLKTLSASVRPIRAG
jgi:hypothetical protein